MNTRGYDSSRLLASHKGVGILRPDGDTQAGADVLALTVRTYYMPNEDWHELCQRGRALREAAGTLTGHAAGQRQRAGAGPRGGGARDRCRSTGRGAADVAGAARVRCGLPRDEDDREFIPTAELVEALDVEPNSFGRAMADFGCPSTRDRITEEDGSARRVRGYRTADIKAAIRAEEL